MANVSILNGLDMDSQLWRYMSLDKLIDLLDSETLFFTPLSYYTQTDPFEGYPPPIVLESIKNTFEKQHSTLEIDHQIRENLLETITDEKRRKEYQKSLCENREQINELKTLPRTIFQKLTKSVAVNCWHNNNVESEAMWKLYSDGGKGIAIETTTKLLFETIKNSSAEEKIIIGAVKYLDFSDRQLKLIDCYSDGHIIPLVKRKSFSHEQEVRAFITQKLKTSEIKTHQPSHKKISIKPENLIKKIHISPFAKEPFITAVIAISKKYGLPEDIVKPSRLLAGHNELLNMLSIE